MTGLTMFPVPVFRHTWETFQTLFLESPRRKSGFAAWRSCTPFHRSWTSRRGGRGVPISVVPSDYSYSSPDRQSGGRSKSSWIELSTRTPCRRSFPGSDRYGLSSSGGRRPGLNYRLLIGGDCSSVRQPRHQVSVISPLVVVADQFDEVFTVSGKDELRKALIETPCAVQPMLLPRVPIGMHSTSFCSGRSRSPGPLND
jgi:hypothetical protein